ncbi:MAG: excinuclease ABC subunit A, partial [Phycisphaerae bacterium]|nr:excinuclease ABC subunit A [Phycisphaerae bacterium]
PHLRRRFTETDSEFVKERLHAYMSTAPCPACGGRRLKSSSLGVMVQGAHRGLDITSATNLSIGAAREFFAGLRLGPSQASIAAPIVKEIAARLGFLESVGLGYLTLDRTSSTLSGGEAQRIRLATQVGSGLVGVAYVLDEPTIGLHQRDNLRLVATLRHLSDIGNSVLVVEHDEDMIRSADHVLDIGPGPGRHGGMVVAQGTVSEICDTPGSVTGDYLSGRVRIEVPAERRPLSAKQSIVVKGAREHNLKGIDVAFPLGGIVCVTGVSGSGKSTLVNEILLKAARRLVTGTRELPGMHDSVTGLGKVMRVVEVDQSPIGRTPRSNPATYTGIFDEIRSVYARMPEAKIRGYEPGRFSFNVKGGRCEVCAGQGVRRIEMHFLPDVFVTCEACKGRRYNRETLEVLYKGKSIADVLDMTIEDATAFFDAHPRIARMLQCIRDVGLGYMQLGQASTTMSGGEAQRVKLASELGMSSAGHTLYVLDEPTTGLHFADVHRLLGVLQRLASNGHTLVVIEHNLDVIKCADWIIDLGPEGGDGGGTLVAHGTPETVAATPGSFTGGYLARMLAGATSSATLNDTSSAVPNSKSSDESANAGDRKPVRERKAATRKRATA